MHPHHQDFLVVGAVEDADASALRQIAVAAPEIVVIELFRGRRLERGDLAALRVDAGHDVLDGAVLAGRVHRLEHQQHRPAVLRIEHVLQLGERFDAGLQRFLGARLVLLSQLARIVRDRNLRGGICLCP